MISTENEARRWEHQIGTGHGQSAGGLQSLVSLPEGLNVKFLHVLGSEWMWESG